MKRWVISYKNVDTLVFNKIVIIKSFLTEWWIWIQYHERKVLYVNHKNINWNKYSNNTDGCFFIQWEGL